MKITKKQKSLMLKVAVVAAIACVAYYVFNNMRSAVSNKVAKQTTKDMAKDVKASAKRQR